MDNMANGLRYSKDGTPQPLRLTEPTPTQIIEEDLLYGVVTAAAIAENLRPGIWQDITTAMCQGASKTKTGSVNDFLFQAMVDSLLSELHALEAEKTAPE